MPALETPHIRLHVCVCVCVCVCVSVCRSVGLSVDVDRLSQILRQGCVDWFLSDLSVGKMVLH